MYAHTLLLIIILGWTVALNNNSDESLKERRRLFMDNDELPAWKNKAIIDCFVYHLFNGIGPWVRTTIWRLHSDCYKDDWFCEECRNMNRTDLEWCQIEERDAYNENRHTEEAFKLGERGNCSIDELLCIRAGSERCVGPLSICDGRADCEDGSDERNCTKCERTAKLCAPLGTCIHKSKVCDGQDDCPDISDELKCACGQCERNNGDAIFPNGRCLDIERVCDGVVDCEGGEDERDCEKIAVLRNATTD